MWKIKTKEDYSLPSVFNGFLLATEQSPGTPLLLQPYLSSCTCTNSIHNLMCTLLFLNICPYASIFP